jgi:hypothetical protein
VMVGAYLGAAVGKSRIDFNFGEEITTNPSIDWVTNLPNPEPSFKRVSLTYGREIVDGLAAVVVAAGPEYSWGIADGKHLYSDQPVLNGGLGTDYYEANPFSRWGLSIDANVEVPVSHYVAFGLRSSLTIDHAESYGLFGITFGFLIQ